MKKMTMGITAAMLVGLASATICAQTTQHHTQMLVMQDPGQGAGEGVGSGLGAGQTSDPLPKDDLFAGTEIFSKNASDVTEITMDPDSLQMVGGTNRPRAHNMILNVVRTYEYDKPGMYNMADVEAIRNRLNTGDWHCSVHTRSLKTGESTDVCNKRRSDDLEESAIITVEPKELTFIHTIRKRGTGQMGDLTGFMPLVSLQGLPALAHIEPDMMSLQIKLDNMQPRFNVQTDIDSAVRVYTQNKEEMDRQIQEATKALQQLDTPEMQQQMQKLDLQLNQLNSPEMQQQLKDAAKHGGLIINLAPPSPDAAPDPTSTPSPAPSPK